MKDSELTLRGHLEELRRRIFISVVAVLVCTSVAFAFFRQIIEVLVRPAGEFGSGEGPQLIFTEATELLGTSIKVSLVAGLILAFPIILYQLIRFVSPGLTTREKRYLFAFMPGTLLTFAAGVVFAYFVLTPPALHFLLTFGDDIATPMLRISKIVNLMIRLLFWMGVVFETPVVMYLLSVLGIVTARGFARFRRYWVIVAFVLGAIITPTFDPVNQALVAVPLLALYEAGILLSHLAERGRRRSQAITHY